MTKEIPLSRGQIALVDDDQYERVAAFKWSALKAPNGKWYAVRATSRKLGRKMILMHRFILDAPDGVRVDHRNGNPCDNRLENIRLATHAENMHNRGPSQNNKCGYKGVCQHGNVNRKKRWFARIRVNGDIYFLGYFGTPEEAARAYDAAAVNLHGEFAWLNFPDEH